MRGIEIFREFVALRLIKRIMAKLNDYHSRLVSWFGSKDKAASRRSYVPGDPGNTEDTVISSLQSSNRSGGTIRINGREILFPVRHRGGPVGLEQAMAAFDAEPLIESYHLVSPTARMADTENDPSHPPELASPFTFADAEFFRVLKRRVLNWQQEQGIRDLYAPPQYLAIWISHVLAILGSGSIAWYFAWMGEWFPVYVCAFTASVLRAFMLLREAHASTHYTVAKNPRLNWIITQISWGMISVQCADRLNSSHVEMHHLYTATYRLDDTAFPGIRTSKREPLHSWNRHQHIYAVLVYAAVLFFAALEEWWALLTQPRFANRRLINVLVSTCFFAFYYGYALATGNLLWLAAAVCPASLLLTAAFAVNHQVIPCAEAADEYALDKSILDRKKRVDFGVYQAKVTPNHSEESWWMNQLLGGLNHHRTHHLLPKAHYHYYPALTRMVNEVLLEFHVSTVTYCDFLSALRGHYDLLKLRGTC